MYLCLLTRQNVRRDIRKKSRKRKNKTLSDSFWWHWFIAAHYTLLPLSPLCTHVGVVISIQTLSETFDNKKRFRLTTDRWALIQFSGTEFFSIFSESTFSSAKVHFSRQDTIVPRLALLQKKIYNAVVRKTKFGLLVNFLLNDWTIFSLLWNANILNSRSKSDHVFVPLENEIKITNRFILPCNEIMTVKRIVLMCVSTKHSLILFLIFFLSVYEPEKSSDLMQEHTRR